MKRIFYFFLAAIMAVASCQKPNQENPGNNNENNEKPDKELNTALKITLKVTSVEDVMAEILVKHNGTTDDTWYGFVTEGTITGNKVTEAVSAKLIELNNKVPTRFESEYTTTLTGLEPQTKYTYIAMGMTSDGEMYTNPVSVTFTTKKTLKMEKNPDWSIEYTGEHTGEDGEVYEHSITVQCPDDDQYFISTIYDQQTIDDYGLEYIAEYECAYYKELMEYDSSITVDDYVNSGSYVFVSDFKYPGEWILFMFGVDDNGDLTGYYAESKPFTITEEEPTPEYSKWLGTKTWTGSNGVSWDITFEKDINNVSYIMYGWENLTGDASMPVPVTWYEEEKVWQIDSYYYGDIEQDGVTISAWFLGSDEQYIWPVQAMPLCLGGAIYVNDEGEVVTDGSGTEIMICEGWEGTYGEYDVVLKYMTFAGVGSDGNIYSFSDIKNEYNADGSVAEYGWPTFPISITETETATAATKSASVDRETLQELRMFRKTPEGFKKNIRINNSLKVK